MDRPTLRAFGLTEHDQRRWAQWTARRRAWEGQATVGGTIALGVAVWMTDGWLLGLAAVAGGWFLVAAAVAAASALAAWGARVLIPAYAAAQQYEAALAAYAVWETRQSIAYWQALSPWAFERELAAAFGRCGYASQLTPRSGDDGVDIHLARGGASWIVQCKATTRPVGPAVVRELYGTLMATGADGAVLAARGGVSTGVRSFARGKPLLLLTLPEIVALAGGTDPIAPWRAAHAPQTPQAPPASPASRGATG